MSVKVTSNVRHDGVNYKKGDVIGDDVISQGQAELLVNAGVATQVDGEDTKGGTKHDREESKVKKRIASNKDGKRKTVSEKAQARNQKKTKAAKAAKGKTVPKATEAGVDGDVPKESPEVDGDGNDSAASAGEVAFSIGDDEYTAKPTKNGQVQYRQNGGMIAKVDFIAAAQEAGVEVEA